MMFAQVPVNVHSDTSLGQWATLIVVVLGAIGMLWTRIHDAKREDLAQQIQKEQRDYMRQIKQGQDLQNGKLATVVEVNKAYHDELIRAVTTTCKAQPVLVQQVNQPKKEVQ
jgi:hypothetical protein